MAWKSMTGFGTFDVNTPDVGVHVEMKSVNHRFSEFQIRLPKEFMALESPIRECISQQVSRGRIDAFVTITTVSQQHAAADWDVIRQLVLLRDEAKAKFDDATGAILLQNWLAAADTLVLQSSPVENERVSESVLTAVRGALEQLVSMRQSEGERIESNMQEKAGKLRALVERIEQGALTLVERRRDRLLERVRELSVTVADDKLTSEIVLFAERSAIDEELVRLQSHLGEFQNAALQVGPIGRKLDFLIQELHREINTIGAKSADLNISKAVVDAKVLIEQLREQAQNIE